MSEERDPNMDMPKDDESYGQGEGMGQGGQDDMGGGMGQGGQDDMGQGDMGQKPAESEEGEESGGTPTA